MSSSSSRAFAAVGLAFLAFTSCKSKSTADTVAPKTDGGTADGGDAGVNPTAGCGGEAGAKTGLVESQTLTVGGAARGYQFFVPTAYDATKTVSLVFAFHEDNGSGAAFRSVLTLEQEAGANAIVVYPDAVSGSWAIDAPDNDIAFVDAMIAAISKTYCVNAAKIFAFGFSRGAYFANQLACRDSAIRAVASHSGGGPFGVKPVEFDTNGNLVCLAPSTAKMVIHGLADTDVQPSEGQKTLDYVVPQNGCGSSTTATTPAPCMSYGNCAAGKPVVSCSIPDLRHSLWPSASSAAWTFFSSL